MRVLASLLVCALATGCATVVNEPLQAVKVETATADGVLVSGAECRAANDRGTFAAKSGEGLRVRRSADQLDLICRHPGQPDAEGRAVSRMNAGLPGNALAGGLIGVMVDQASGAGYTYPTWVRLIFGKSLVFDRANEQDGQPHLGIEPGTKR